MNKDIATAALEMSLKAGASDARISLFEGKESSIEMTDAQVENLKESFSSSLNISIFTEGKFGAFYTNRLEKEDLRSFIDNCIKATRLIAPDPFRKLPESSLYFNGVEPDFHLYDPCFDEYSFGKKLDLLKNSCSEIDFKDSRIITVASSYDDSVRREYTISSNNLEVFEQRTIFAISNEFTLRDEGDSKPQNGWNDGAAFIDEIPFGITSCGFERSIAMLGARKISSGKYNVVFENTVSSKAIGAILSALQGSSIVLKSSFLENSIGKQVFPKEMTLTDRPHVVGNINSSCFDSEGVATREFDIISEGVVNSFLLNTYYAGKLYMPRTISNPVNPCLKPNCDFGKDKIIRQMDKGILITAFNGGNTNPVTGDFSFGCEGFYFQAGEIQYPVKEMNISGNFISLWRNLCFIGNDPLGFMRRSIPTLAFNDVDISGL